MALTSLGWLTTIITLIFVVLKLTGEITWPWVGVLAPTLIHWSVWLVLVGLTILLNTLAEKRKY